MNITAIGNAHGPHQGFLQTLNEQKDAALESKVPAAHADKSPPPIADENEVGIPITIDAVVAEVSDEENVPGVIRNLEASHFKGVADVRLRINFFDHLSARAASAAIPFVQDAASSLVQEVGSGVESLIESLALEAEEGEAITVLFAEFSGEIDSAVATLQDQIQLDSQSVSESIQMAFDSLLEQVTVSLNPSLPDNEAVDASTETPGDDDPMGGIEDALQTLQSLFDEAFARLVASVSDATTMSDPAEHTGNGSAYDKFLAIYNELRGLESTVDLNV